MVAGLLVTMLSLVKKTSRFVFLVGGAYGGPDLHKSWLFCLATPTF